PVLLMSIFMGCVNDPPENPVGMRSSEIMLTGGFSGKDGLGGLDSVPQLSQTMLSCPGATMPLAVPLLMAMRGRASRSSKPKLPVAFTVCAAPKLMPPSDEPMMRMTLGLNVIGGTFVGATLFEAQAM